MRQYPLAVQSHALHRACEVVRPVGATAVPDHAKAAAKYQAAFDAGNEGLKQAHLDFEKHGNDHSWVQWLQAAIGAADTLMFAAGHHALAHVDDLIRKRPSFLLSLGRAIKCHTVAKELLETAHNAGRNLQQGQLSARAALQAKAHTRAAEILCATSAHTRPG